MLLPYIYSKFLVFCTVIKITDSFLSTKFNSRMPFCGVTRGARGDICRRAQHFRGAKLRSECYVLITKCQMSADVNNYNLIKITRVRKASNYEPKWCFKAEFLSPAMTARLWFDSALCHNAFAKPGMRTFRLPYNFIVASQWDGNPAFTVHAECYIVHAFIAAIKLTRCYQGCAERAWTRRRPWTSKAVGHPKSEITKSAFIKIL